MKRILALLLSLAFCLTAAACSLLPSKPEDTGKDTSSSTTPSLTPDPVTTPSITTDTPVTTPPEPVKTTAPPVTDPPSPHEPGRLLGSGVIVSDSGLKLNILLDWKAVNGSEEGTADISVTVYLECYSIFVGTRDDGEIMLDSQMIHYSTPMLEIGGPQFNEIDFGTYTFSVKKAQGTQTVLPLSGKWHFRGEYSGLSLDWVIAQGEISFQN